MSTQRKTLTIQHNKRGYEVIVYRDHYEDVNKRYKPTKSSIKRIQRAMFTIPMDRNIGGYFHDNCINITWCPHADGTV